MVLPMSQRADQGSAHQHSFRPPQECRIIQAHQEPCRRKPRYTALRTHRFPLRRKNRFLGDRLWLSVLLTACLCAERYLQFLARALSHYFKARLLILDVNDFSLRVRKRLLTTFNFDFAVDLMFSKLFHCWMFLQIQSKYGGSSKAVVSYCDQGFSIFWQKQWKRGSWMYLSFDKTVLCMLRSFIFIINQQRPLKK